MITDKVGIRGLKPWGNPYAMQQGAGYQINWVKVSDYFAAGKLVVQANGAATAGATGLTVDPIPSDIADGERLDFNGQILTLTADAKQGAVSLSTTPLTANIADNAQGVYQRQGISAGEKFIPEATVMALDTSTTPTTLIPRRDAGSEQASHLLTSDAYNGRQAASHSRSGYGTVVGDTFLFENLLPDADPTTGNLPSAYKTELIANAHFKAADFVKYVDTRAN